MTRTGEWTVRLHLFEEDRTTKARMVVDTGTTSLTGHGRARCQPEDVDVPEIGDELAASRAMSDLAAQLMKTAYDGLEGVRASSRGIGSRKQPTGQAG
ncbi:DUF1876 domain-containing protein [Streptomyces sp. NPDC048506]|uniref:DUF1876 domain-containing protein n=1 Tax=Streptomyces sp. NPDC048506 TaxID=3155028 RepID=UPI0034156A1C